MHCIENGPDNEEIIDILCRVCDGTRERTKKKKRNEKDKWENLSNAQDTLQPLLIFVWLLMSSAYGSL